MTAAEGTERDAGSKAEPAAIEPAAAAETSEARRGVGIEAVGLTRRFGSHLALDALHLRIDPGESFGLLGANGAGKTTFIRLVTGYLLPSAGSISVDGLSPIRDAAKVHARMGFVPETTRLYPDLRVTAFLRFMGGARGLAGRVLDHAIDDVIERFALGTVARRWIGHLSKGFQQRVSLAQAFLHDPPLVIVDEPSSGLDPQQQAEVRQLLRDRRGRCTLILCTHDLTEARAVTRRAAVLDRGRVAAIGATDNLLGGADPLQLFRNAPADEARS